ncbi:ABC transporter permease [Saccharicrinis sp. FJH2]|uniref:ABC transporter permease n=1 Tax=Saccharicrinis sp. FJH65 TaxID=3344659 RepID=UPI0035F4F0FB
MSKINLKSISLNLKRHSLYSITSIISITLGLTVILTLSNWIFIEKSFDKFHKNQQDIYRVVINGKAGDLIIKSARTGAPLAKSLENNFPEVKAATRILKIGSVEVTTEDKNALYLKAYGVDTSFFSIFDVSFINGYNKEILSNPNEVILTEKAANRLFGSNNVAGNKLDFFIDGNKHTFTIKSVVNNFPNESHFHFDILFSMNTLRWTDNEQWLSTDFYTYLLLQKNIDIENLQKKINEYTLNYIAPIIKDFNNASLTNSENYFRHDLQKLTDIHLHSNFNDELEQNGDVIYIKLFVSVLVLILIITSSIFITLTKIRIHKSHKEIYVRKVSGARNDSLFYKFLSEIIIITVISIFISFILLETLVPLILKIENFRFTDNFSNYIILLTVSLMIAFTVAMVSIPSTIKQSLSSLINRNHNISKKNSFNALMVIQLVISVIVIFSTLIINRQLRYMENDELGMTKENIINVKGIDKLGNSLESFKNSLLNNPEIEQVTYSYTIPGEQFPEIACKKIIKGSKESFVMAFCPCDFSFKDVFQLEILQGRFFSNDYSNDNKIVINESAAKILRYNNVLNNSIEFGGKTFKIIGVVKNFHFDSKQKEIKPMAFVTMPTVYAHWIPNYLSIKTGNNNSVSTVAFLEKQWKKFTSDNYLKYSFFENSYNSLYSKETYARRILIILSVIAMVIITLGLVSISIENIQQRTKEVGIRKVNGATVSNVVKMLNQKYFLMLILSLFIAFPVAYYVIDNWLQSFAYRINIGVGIFFITSVLLILVTILSINIQVYRAAIQNPVMTLKDE